KRFDVVFHEDHLFEQKGISPGQENSFHSHTASTMTRAADASTSSSDTKPSQRFQGLRAHSGRSSGFGPSHQSLGSGSISRSSRAMRSRVRSRGISRSHLP